MEFVEGTKPVWDKMARESPDAYSRCAVDFVVAWADAMEARLAAGETVAACAKATFDEVNARPLARGGVTGFQYGWIVGALAHHWVHGDALRRWHNLEVQLGDEGERANREGGTLNPAVLTVDV